MTMRVEVRIRIDEPEGKTAMNFHYVDITAEGDTKAVLDFLDLVKETFGKDHIS